MGDTIFAVAAGGHGAALTVVRLSGAGAGDVLDSIWGTRPAPRRAALRALRGCDGGVLDRALVLWFPGPSSYTGEDCGELHLHGGRAVMLAVARRLVALGARPAEPGEFTRRAFLNGRMDLTEAEGVADLVAAETEAQRRQAFRQLEGALGALYRGWSERLTRLSAGYEALIDFAEEDDGLVSDAGFREQALFLATEIAAHLDDGRRGERVREGLVFAITGAPNVGKSSLMNALAASDVAIVSERPGTTRDVIETRLELGGLAVTLLDTAGLRETSDPVEAEGIRRARVRAAQADLVIELVDASDRGGTASISTCTDRTDRTIVVMNKIDLLPPADRSPSGVSALSGHGIGTLRDRLAAAAQALVAGGADAPLTRERHRSALLEAVSCLENVATAEFPELCAEEVRLALRALGRVTGRVGVEDVLDAVFAQFCIGK